MRMAALRDMAGVPVPSQDFQRQIGIFLSSRSMCRAIVLARPISFASERWRNRLFNSA
jgi:hypothetical protein